MDPISPKLVGRAREREAIAGALAALHGGAGGVLVIEGEPGIGKSRLLEHLVEQAEGCVVLAARASEYEADLPYALWAEALGGEIGAGAADRHRLHRELRDRLERIAADAPLVLCLDDVHWADPASAEANAALLHRPPAGRVLLALATRTGQLPLVLTRALAAARPVRLAPGPLGEPEARELVGESAATVYADSGGNPFYLEQLARGRGAGKLESDGSVPPAVAAALAAEIGELPRGARRLLDAAAVVGDPFEAGIAAEVAELDESDALAALDVLLLKALVRPGGAPRRFAFRHPVVRHAVYEAAPGGWRLGAHGRADRALARRDVGVVQRAHHVEHAAGPGDEEAIAVLDAAATELRSLAPATAARLLAAVLRLLPDGRARAPVEIRLADAQAAAGDATGSRDTLLAALRTAAPGDRLALTVGVANAEWWIGRTDDARRRLHVALAELPAQPSLDRIRLRLALALTALMAADLADARGQAGDARDDARAIGEPVFEAAALACGALALTEAVDLPGAGAAVDEAAAALERLSPAQLATRLPAFWMLARARRTFGLFAPALADLERGSAIAADTGRENILAQLTIETAATLVELGRLEEAVTAAEQGLDMARLAGNPRVLLWARCTLSTARLANGDVAGALLHATAAAESGTTPDFHSAGEPGWCLGRGLTAAGNPDRAIAAMLESFGGGSLGALLPADRPAAAADLAAAQLAAGDAAAADRTLRLAEETAARTGRSWLAALPGVIRSEHLLGLGRADHALSIATAARDAATGAPLTAALGQLAEGRALAATGRRREAVEVLVAAESRLDGFGAMRLRDQAARELRRLGHRVRRPSSETGSGLTEREHEIARLVAAGRTNREVAEQLVLSTRTIEAHLRNIYGKLGVRSRVELTRTLVGDS